MLITTEESITNITESATRNKGIVELANRIAVLIEPLFITPTQYNVF